MDLPTDLRRAVEQRLDAVALSDLKAASAALTQRYRAETLDGRAHLSEALSAAAYLAARLPATYAAVRAAIEATADRLPEFRPRTLLDVGAGPGTASFAALDRWISIEHATLVEASASIRSVGEGLCADALAARTHWIAGNAMSASLPKADMVTLAYVLDELPPAAGLALVGRLWEASEGVLLIVEPGTPAGWRRIVAVRDALIGAGGLVVAPCPHHGACPVAEPDWCHFAQRLARSRVHRLTKQGDAPFEDEKYAYVAVARRPPADRPARILAPPRAGSGKVQLKLCRPNGRLEYRLVTRRDGETFRTARRADWGDALAVAAD